eukprot:IDg7198t1
MKQRFGVNFRFESRRSVNALRRLVPLSLWSKSARMVQLCSARSRNRFRSIPAIDFRGTSSETKGGPSMVSLSLGHVPGVEFHSSPPPPRRIGLDFISPMSLRSPQ